MPWQGFRGQCPSFVLFFKHFGSPLRIMRVCFQALRNSISSWVRFSRIFNFYFPELFSIQENPLNLGETLKLYHHFIVTLNITWKWIIFIRSSISLKDSHKSLRGNAWLHLGIAKPSVDMLRTSISSLEPWFNAPVTKCSKFWHL